MKPLIDGDVMVYELGFSADKEDMNLYQTQEKIDTFMEDMLTRFKTRDYRIFITGKGEPNYREVFYPDYKANRDVTHKPLWYEEIQEYLITRYNAEVCDGMEADDGMGLAQTEDTIICTIDKDLDTVPGWHFNWRKPENGRVWIDDVHAFRLFCIQCLTGDPTDNIPGMRKILGKNATKKYKQPLFDTSSKEEMWNWIEEVYKDNLSMLYLVASLLWIRHKLYVDEHWWLEL